MSPKHWISALILISLTTFSAVVGATEGIGGGGGSDRPSKAPESQEKMKSAATAARL